MPRPHACHHRQPGKPQITLGQLLSRIPWLSSSSRAAPPRHRPPRAAPSLHGSSRPRDSSTLPRWASRAPAGELMFWAPENPGRLQSTAPPGHVRPLRSSCCLVFYNVKAVNLVVTTFLLQEPESESLMWTMPARRPPQRISCWSAAPGTAIAGHDGVSMH